MIFFGNGNGVNGTEMAVARSADGGKIYPAVTFFSLLAALTISMTSQ